MSNTVHAAILAKDDVSVRYDPNKQADRGDGTLAPECYGLAGYGDGFQYAGRCDRRNCDAADACWYDLREVCTELMPESLGEFNTRLTQLRTEEGMDSNEAIRHLQREGVDLPLQDVYLANVRRGQMASGHWIACEREGCTRLIGASANPPFCYEHVPHPFLLLGCENCGATVGLDFSDYFNFSGVGGGLSDYVVIDGHAPIPDGWVMRDQQVLCPGCAG